MQSSRNLKDDEISLLMKGPTFCPSTSGKFLDAKAEIKNFTRKLKLREKYFDCNFTNDALVRGKNNNAVTSNNNELNRLIDQIENIAPEKISMDKNISN